MKKLFFNVLVAGVLMFITVETAEDPAPPAAPPAPPKTAAAKKPPPPTNTANGEDCSENSECVNGLCEAGKCVDPCIEKAKGKEKFEDCTEGDECKSRVCFKKKCITTPGCAPDGKDCLDDSECVNGLCEGDPGKCADPCKEKATGKENDDDCTEGHECKSRICYQDKCIAPPGCAPGRNPF